MKTNPLGRCQKGGPVERARGIPISSLVVEMDRLPRRRTRVQLLASGLILASG